MAGSSYFPDVSRRGRRATRGQGATPFIPSAPLDAQPDEVEEFDAPEVVVDATDFDEPSPQPVADYDYVSTAQVPALPALKPSRNIADVHQNRQRLSTYVSAMDRFDAREMKTRQIQAQKQQKAAAMVEQKRANAEREATFRGSRIKSYTDSFGDIQAVVDPETGKPRFEAHKGPVQYDEKSGEAYRREVDESGEPTIKALDEDAEIGTHPERPGELYRQTKHRPWQFVCSVNDGLRSADPRVKAAAAKGAATLEKDLADTSVKALDLKAGEVVERKRAAALGFQQYQRAAVAKEAEIEALKVDPKFSEKTGGIFGQIGAQPTPAALALQSRARKLQEERDALDKEAPVFDPKPFDEELKNAREDEAAWKAAIARTGSAGMAARERKQQLAEAGLDSEKDPVLGALKNRRQQLGLPMEDEEAERIAQDERLRGDPRFARTTAARDAIMESHGRGELSPEQANAKLGEVNQEVRAINLPDAAKQATMLKLQAAGEKDATKRTEIETAANRLEQDFAGPDFDEQKAAVAGQVEGTRAAMVALRESRLPSIDEQRAVMKTLPIEERKKFMAALSQQEREREMLKSFTGGEERELTMSEEAGTALGRLIPSMTGRLAGFTKLLANVDPAQQVATWLSGGKFGTQATHRMMNPLIKATGEIQEALPMSPSQKGKTFAPGDPKWWIANAIPTVAELGLDLGIAALTGPAAPITFMALGGGKMGGDAYNDAEAWHREHGRSEADAQALATGEGLIVGALGALLDRIPAGEFLLREGVGKKVLFSTVRNRMVRNGMTGFVAEALPEMGQELVAMLAESGFRDSSEAFHDGWNRLFASGLLGGAAGAGVDVMIGAREDMKLRKDIDALRTVNGAATDSELEATFADGITPAAVELGAMVPEEAAAELAQIRATIEQAAKVNDLEGLAEAYGQRLDLAAKAGRNRGVQAASDEIDGMQLGTPEETAATQMVLRGLVKVAGGQPLEALTAAELAALESPTADGLPRIEKVGKGVVITDAALERLRSVAPVTARIMPESESTQRKNILSGSAESRRAAIPGLSVAKAKPAPGQATSEAADQPTASGSSAPPAQNLTPDGGGTPSKATTSAASDRIAPRGTFSVEIERPGGEVETVEVEAENAEAAEMQVAGGLKPGSGMVRNASEKAVPPTEGAAPDFVAEAVRQIETQTRRPLSATQRGGVEKIARAIEPAFRRWEKAFAGVNWSATSAESAGASVQGGRITFHLSDIIAHASDYQRSPAMAENVVSEEAIHAVTVDLEESGVINLTEIYMSLPESVRRALEGTYLPAKTDFQRAHEFWRLWMQGDLELQKGGRIRLRGEFLTEQANRGFIVKIRKALARLLSFFRDMDARLRKAGADDATLAAVARAQELIREKVKEVDAFATPTIGRETSETKRSEPLPAKAADERGGAETQPMGGPGTDAGDGTNRTNTPADDGDGTAVAGEPAGVSPVRDAGEAAAGAAEPGAGAELKPADEPVPAAYRTGDEAATVPEIQDQSAAVADADNAPDAEQPGETGGVAAGDVGSVRPVGTDGGTDRGSAGERRELGDSIDWAGERIALAGEWRAKNPRGQEVFRGKWALVPLRLLQGNTQFGIAQDRIDRARTGAAQRLEIINNVTPETVEIAWGASPTLNDGAPIVTPEGSIEVGNNRTLALREMATNAPEKAALYDEWARAEAGRLGLEAQSFAGEPVALVRVDDGNRGGLTQKDFVRASNTAGVEQRSVAETALADRTAFAEPALLNALDPNEDGSFNSEFLGAFYRAVGSPKELRFEDGTPDDGKIERRAQAALLAHLLGTAPGVDRVLTSLMDNLATPGIKQVVSGLAKAGPALVNAAAINPALSISPNIGRALGALLSYRRAKDAGEVRNVDEFRSQAALFPGDEAIKDALDAKILSVFAEARSVKAVSERFLRYAKAVEDFGDPGQERLFGPEPAPDPMAYLASQPLAPGANEAELLWNVAQAETPEKPGAAALLRAEVARLEQMLAEDSAAGVEGLIAKNRARLERLERQDRETARREANERDPKQWALLYRKLFALEQSGVTLKPEQRVMLEKAEAALGQKLLFGDETRGTPDMETFKARWENAPLRGDDVAEQEGLFDQRGAVGRMPADEAQGRLFAQATGPALSERQQRLRAAFSRMWEQDREGMIAAYRREFGNVINADNARELFPPFRRGTNDERGWMTDVTSGISQDIAQAVYRQVIAEAPHGSRVRFTAGGPGSGKSSGVESETGAIVFDSTFSTPDKAREMVSRALDAGHNVRIRFVYQPLDAAVRNIVTRAVDEGRIAEIGGSAERHQAALQTVRDVAREFEGRVDVRAFDNTDFQMREMTAEEFDALPVLSVDVARAAAYSSLDDEFAKRAGEPGYTPELFRLLGGGVAQDAGPRGGRDSGSADAGTGAPETRVDEGGEVGGDSLKAQPTRDPNQLGLDFQAAEQDAEKSAAERFQAGMPVALGIARGYYNVPGAESDDVEQHARIALAKAARVFDAGRGVPFAAFARVAVNNELRSLFRKGARSREFTTLDEPLGEEEDETRTGAVPDLTTDVAREVERAEGWRILRETIGELPERMQTALAGVLAGRRLEDIGEELGGITRQGVSTMVAEAMRRLRGKLGERGIARASDLLRAQATNELDGAINAQLKAQETSDPIAELFALLDSDVIGDFRTQAEKEETGWPGSKTIGRPDLALGGEGPGIASIHEYHTLTQRKESIEEWDQAADQLLSDPATREPFARDVVNRWLNGDRLRPYEVRAAQRVLIEMQARARLSQKDQDDFDTFGYAFAKIGEETARELAARRDPWKTREQRNREFIAKTWTRLTPKQQALIDTAKDKTEKVQRLKAIMREKRARADKALEMILGKGATLDDLLHGETELRLKGEKIIYNTAKSYDAARQEAIKLMQGGEKNFEEIAKLTKLKPEEVQKLKAEFVQALRDKLRERVRHGAKVESLEGVLMAQAASPTVRSDAETEAELDRIIAAMGFVPDAQQGKMKIVRRKRRKVSRPSPAPFTGQLPGTRDIKVEPRTQDDLLNPVRNRVTAPTGILPIGSTEGQQQDALGRVTNATVSPTGILPIGSTEGQQQDALGNVTNATVAPTGILPIGSTEGQQQDALKNVTNATIAPTGILPIGETHGRQSRMDLPSDFNQDEWVETMVREGVDLSNRDDMVRAARMVQAADGNRFDMLFEYWVNSILSGLVTQISNITGNMFNAGWDLTGQRAGEALLNLVYRNPDAAQLGEFSHLARGLVPGFREAWDLATRTWSTEDSQLFEYHTMNVQEEFEGFDKGGGHPPTISETPLEQFFGKSARPVEETLGKLGKFNPVRGRVIRMPARALLFADTFFKMAIGRMEAGAQAYRIAKNEGLKGDAMSRRINALVGTPGSEAWKRAVVVATRNTFQEDLLTYEQADKQKKTTNIVENAVARFNHMRSGSHLLGFFFPFIRTPYRIFEQGLKKSPLGTLNAFARLANAGFYKIKDGKPMFDSYSAAQQVRDISEQLIAWSTLALLYGMAAGDDDDEEKFWLLTGSAPSQMTKPGERELKQRVYGGPYTLRIGGRGGLIIPWGRIEPVATVVGTVLDQIALIKQRARGKLTPGAALDKLFGYFVSQAQEKTFLRGFTDISKTIQDSSNLSDFAKKSFMEALVPNLLRQPLRNLDDYVRDTKGAPSAYLSLPSGALAEKRNDLYGNPQTKTGNPISRLFFASTVEPYAELQQADRLLMNWMRANPDAEGDETVPSSPRSRTLRFQDARGQKHEREMTAAEWSRFTELAGRFTVRNLRGKITNRQIERPTGADVKLIRKAIDDAREEAKERLTASGSRAAR